MRLAAPISDSGSTPESWVASLRRAGFRAGNAPISPDVAPDVAAAYADAARQADIVIAEVGAWSNPIDPDPAKARQGRPGRR